MNIVAGRTVGSQEAHETLGRLYDMTAQTLGKGKLEFTTVIDACGQLSRSLNEEEHLGILTGLGLDEPRAKHELAEVKEMLSRDYLLNKMKIELGDSFDTDNERSLPDGGRVLESIQPLGVLLHIAAGNAHGLPVFSVLEGLLTGNINILKLPGVDDGISAMLIMELIKIEPILSEYIYVFDFPSEDMEAMQSMAACADAIIVWGGDTAVSAVRKLAPENTKIIEWGHKISFSYITGQGMEDAALRGLAHNICETEQLLCSSCQGIYVDTDKMEDVYNFCERFLPVLQQVCEGYPQDYDMALRAQISLELRTRELDSIDGGNRVYRGKGCSLLAMAGGDLSTSLAFRNCWVRALPHAQIVNELRKHKNHLQTVGLLCSGKERAELAGLFFKTGVVSVTTGKDMSETTPGQPHDGEYALRRYVKITSVKYPANNQE